MSFNVDRFNVVLSQQDVQDIESALDLLENKFSFLRTLTTEEKSRKVRLGVNNMAFVQTAKDAFDDMPDLLPSLFSDSGYENDIAMLNAIRPYQYRLDQLSYLMEDTAILLGDHIFKDSLVIFRSAQEAMKRGIDGSRLWVEKLETRFEGQGPRRSDESDQGMDSQGGSASDGGSGNQGGGSGNPTNGSGSQGSDSNSQDNDPASPDSQSQGSGNPSDGGGTASTNDAG